MASDREKLLENLLTQFIKPMKGIPFELVIKSLWGVSVEKFDLDIEENRQNLELIVQAMVNACKYVQKKPIERSRPNEVGNDMEPFVITALANQNLRASSPKTKAGKGKSTGYPDVKIETDAISIYLEVKTFASANHDTTQRSFYLSPAKDPKVSDDGYHLLVGFEIERRGNLYIPVGFEIVDLYGLDCDMKAEFNSDNKRLYKEDRVIARKSLPMK